MKKKYDELEMEIVEFDSEDIITNSTGEDGGEDYGDGELIDTGEDGGEDYGDGEIQQLEICSCDGRLILQK